MLGQPAKHQLERHTPIYVLHGVGGLDGPGKSHLGFQRGISCYHPLQGPVCHSVTSLHEAVLVGRIRGCRSIFNAVKLTQILNLSIEKLCSSVTHDVLWGAVVFEPLCHQVLGYRGTLLVVDEAGGLELAEGVTKVEDEGRSILVPAVLLEINSKDVVVADGSGGCYPRSGQPAVFNCTNLALGEVVNSLDGVLVPHLCLLHHVFDLVGVGVAESLVQVDDLFPGQRLPPSRSLQVLRLLDFLHLGVLLQSNIGHYPLCFLLGPLCPVHNLPGKIVLLGLRHWIELEMKMA